ncbi:MAG: segregation/condensation protein A [Alicyclobacillus sp.]|nr:segregation/condensation protein A [Alicyclobacillus sp.]
MAYDIVLDVFEGPLDLLLHLIQKHEINIHDIPIASITEQYMDYLRAMEELSLEVASEFVVMAATLLAIKSRMLLPRPAPTADSDDVEAEDPREQLVQQLLEYQRCKWAAQSLRERELLQSQVFSRPAMDLRPFAPAAPPPVEGVTLWDLVDAFRRIYKRLPKQERVTEIRGHVISVDEMMANMLTRLRKWRTCTFDELVSFCHTRMEFVSAFLALLELTKNGQIRCTQKIPFGVIRILLTEETEAC